MTQQEIALRDLKPKGKPMAVNINAYMAEAIENMPESAVMISINDEEELYRLKIPRDPERVLTLQFTDITAPVQHKGRTWSPISTEDTYRVLEFIKKHQGKNFIVHCAAGISRSAAVCLYLHIEHGYELKENFWAVSHPNPLVLGKLMLHKYENVDHLLIKPKNYDSPATPISVS